MQATWMPHEKHGRLTEQSDLPDTVYAFPKQRKEPLTDAQHVRNAVAQFDQVTGVSDSDRALAFANIEKAAKHYDVNLSERLHGTTSAFIPNAIGKRLPPKALRRASASTRSETESRLR